MQSSICSYLYFFFSLYYWALLLSPSFSVSESILTHSIHPNFTASYLQFVDNGGSFLSSNNNTFSASLHSPSYQSSRFYFSIIHVPTNTIIWSANRNKPISDSSHLSLTADGLAISDEFSNLVWSTPPLTSPVNALQLLETGNLMLVDSTNVSLWQSFDHPTDTIVVGQRFSVGESLLSSMAADDFSVGNYRLALSGEELALLWFGKTYWKLSMEPNSKSNPQVSFMEINGSGLYIHGFAVEDSWVIGRIVYGASSFRIARLGFDGRFMVNSFNGEDWVQELVRPVEFCGIPYSCGNIGLCMGKDSGINGLCTCPRGFRVDNTKSGCLPDEKTFSLSTGCNVSGGSGKELESIAPTNYYYLKLGNALDYFENGFVDPKRGVNLTLCQDLCSHNCSCLGIFHQNSSGSCYLVENYIGSMIQSNDTESDFSGYLKAYEVSSPQNRSGNKKRDFPVAGFVLIPLSGFFLAITIVAIVILLLYKKRPCRRKTVELSRWTSSSSAELGKVVSFPGLPSRFEYEELVAATKNFNTEIGSGGFGTVYKGTLADETVVAVKKITNLGVRGKKEFCTEMAIIASVHHANLVRLKGFCIQGRQRFLVYEFMNRGSLERILFGNDPVLEWQHRFKIVHGTARALAYLHSGCHQKIIHCDIKPENILLNDSFQVKISDFGLSKLLDHESSKLFTTLRGTRGYLAPEWLTSSGITAKTDVYSFGMVLLEIVSGRRNCSLLTQNNSNGNDGKKDNCPSFSSSSKEGLIFFPSLALEMHKQKRYKELADPRLEGRVSGQEIEKIVRIALCCVHIVPAMRPTMDNVVAMLEGRVPLGEPRVEALNFLLSFGGRQCEQNNLYM